MSEVTAAPSAEVSVDADASSMSSEEIVLDENAGNDVEPEAEQEEEKEETYAEWKERTSNGKDIPKEKEEDEADDEDADAEDSDDSDEKKKKSKDDGELFEFTVDGKKYTATREQVPQLLAKAAGADVRYAAAANLRKETQQFVSDLKENTIDTLSKAGIDFEQLAIDYVYDKFEYEQMTEEQQGYHDQKKENARLKEENDAFTKGQRDLDEAQKQQREHELHQQQVREAQNSLSQEIMSTINEAGLPKNKFTVGRFASYMKEGLSKGVDLSPQDVLKFVQQDYDEMLEGARKADVKEYKQTRKEESRRKTGKTGNKKGTEKKSKRITSIYQLLE